MWPRCAWLLAVAGWGCVDVEPALVPAAGTVRFLVTVDEVGRPLGAPIGPFFPGDRLPAATPVREDQTLVLLDLDEAQLMARFPAFDQGARTSMTLVAAPAELEECAESGVLTEDRFLAVPIAALGAGLTAQALSGPSAGQSAPIPPSLALHFEARVCDRGPKLRLIPFAQHYAAGEFLPPDQDLGRIPSMAALDADTILVFAVGGIITVRRGALVDMERDTVPVTELIQAPSNRDAWDLTSGALAPEPGPRGERDLLLSFTLTEDWGLPSTNGEAGAALVHVSLEPDGRFVVRNTWIVDREDAPDRISLRTVRLEADGRWLAYGRHLVATSTALSADPNIQFFQGFDVEWAVRLEEPNAPYILGDGSGQVFEGDPHLGIDLEDIYPVANVSDARFNDGTRLHDAARSVVGVGSDGRAWIRTRARSWSPYDLSLPSSASQCAASANRCGRRIVGAEPHRALGVPGHGGMLVGCRSCNGLLWRSALDGCASAIPVGGTNIEAVKVHEGVGALLEHEGRLYVAAGDRRLYEVELEQPE